MKKTPGYDALPDAFVREKWPKSVRLAFTSEFQKVRTKGRVVHSSGLQISCLREEGKSIRIGLVTSRKVGGAVERNRTRRRLREIFRRLLSQMSSGYWLVVTAKPKAASLPFSILQEECLLLTRRLSILPPAQ